MTEHYRGEKREHFSLLVGSAYSELRAHMQLVTVVVPGNRAGVYS